MFNFPNPLIIFSFLHLLMSRVAGHKGNIVVGGSIRIEDSDVYGIHQLRVVCWPQHRHHGNTLLASLQ